MSEHSRPTGGEAESGPRQLPLPFQITDSALRKIAEFSASPDVKDGECFRVGVEGGGCAGFKYVFEFSAREEGDLEYFVGDLRLLVDPITLQYMTGSTLDYLNTLNEAGFAVSNPNAKATCGCGMSFGV